MSTRSPRQIWIMRLSGLVIAIIALMLLGVSFWHLSLDITGLPAFIPVALLIIAVALIAAGGRIKKTNRTT